jgi:hypothetical protein
MPAQPPPSHSPKAQPRPRRTTALLVSTRADLTIALATFQFRGLGEFTVAVGHGEQPRARRTVSWLRLSGRSSQGACRPGRIVAAYIGIR